MKKYTLCERLLSYLLCASIVLGVIIISGENVIAADDPATGLSYTILNNEATITGFTPPAEFSGSLLIPGMLGGVSVTAIGEIAFKDCTALTNISVPSGVTSIGACAFYGCVQLNSIILPGSVANICDEAFSHTGLTTVTKKGAVPSIGFQTFTSKITDAQYENINFIVPQGTGETYNNILTAMNEIKYTITEKPNVTYDINGGTVRTDIEYTDLVSAGDYTSFNGEPTRPEYTFGGWYKDAACTEGNIWNFTVDTVIENITLYAKWIHESYSIIAAPNNSSSGMITGSGPYEINSSATLTATANNGFRFVRWTEGGSEVTDSNPYTFTVTGDRNLTAEFIGVMTVKFNVNGGIPGSGSDYTQRIDYGSLAASPINPPTRAAYSFAGWYKDAACTAGNEWNFAVNTVTQNTTLYAKWTTGSYTISASQNNPAYGTVTGIKAGTYSYGESVTLTAVANAGYQFNRWLEGIFTITHTNPYSFTVTGNRTLTAEFVSISTGFCYTISNNQATITGFKPPSGFNGILNIPDTLDGVSVTTIGYGAFVSCKSLIEVTIPDGITAIEADAFFCCDSMTGISIPNSVTRIGDCAFFYCTGLETITIPDSVVYIGEYAFRDCTSLTSLVIPNSVTDIGQHAFESCTNLESAFISNQVTIIRPQTFYECTNLKSIIIPNGVKTIDSDAFSGCTALLSITIPRSVNNILEPFGNCPSLEQISVDASNPEYKSIEGVLYTKDESMLLLYPGAKKGSITFTASITNIWSGAFSSYHGSGKLTIPEGVLGIGHASFAGCGFDSVILPESLLSISGYAFAENNFDTVTIPSRVSLMASTAFYKCANLTTVFVAECNSTYQSIDGIVYTIDRKTLQLFPAGKSNIDSILSSVRDISPYTFAGCQQFDSITIPLGITNIGEAAFRNCSNLHSIIIPSSVTSIGFQAFETSGLTSITILGDVPSIGQCSFYWLAFNCADRTLHVNVPQGTEELYSELFNSPGIITGKYLVSETRRISYNVNGGISRSNVEYAELVPTNGLADGIVTPTRPEFKFDGWYRDSACTDGEEWNFTTDIVSEDITLYAKWNPIQYTALASAINPALGTVIGAGILINDNSMTLTAIPKTGYRFVRWMEGTAELSRSNPVTITLVETRNIKAEFAALYAPANLRAASAGYNKNGLSWTASTGATGYAIYRSKSPTSGFTLIGFTKSTRFTDIGLTTGTVFYYKIKAYTFAGTSRIYSLVTAAVSAKPVPSIPVNLTATRVAPSGLKISWSPVTGATGYIVYRSTTPTSGFTPIASITTPTYTNLRLTVGRKYYYKIKAYTAVKTAKIYSPASAAVSGTP